MRGMAVAPVCVIAAVYAAAVLASCTGRDTGSADGASPPAPSPVSSFARDASYGGLVNADSSFFDFIYFFATDSQFRHSRTAFPPGESFPTGFVCSVASG